MTRPAVLVIDDEIGNLRVFQRVFRARLDVLAATTWAEACELIRTRAPVAAFVDLSMPKPDGIAVLHELRARWPEITRYLLTGYRDAALEQVEGGLCAAVLGKPWEREEIEAAIARVLNGT